MTKPLDAHHLLVYTESTIKEERGNMKVAVTYKTSGAQEVKVKTRWEKSRDSILSKDKDFYKKIGRKGGFNSSHRPFRDPNFARAAVNKRWETHRREKAKTND
jgi:general stress protein YciG